MMFFFCFFFFLYYHSMVFISVCTYKQGMKKLNAEFVTTKDAHGVHQRSMFNYGFKIRERERERENLQVDEVQ